jgi:holliday junction DNA helicase RuvB
MAENSRLVSALAGDDEQQFEVGLRPRRLADFTGQTRLKENLQIAIDAAKKRGEAMDHVLLYGPPGLGKTTLASIIAQELDVPFTQTSGPVLQKKLDLSGILSGITHRQVFFIDEIHRLLPDVEEMLYTALEDFHLDILIGTGPGARTHSIPLQNFTAIGATTRQGLVSAPMRGRFGLVLRLNLYDVPELTNIVKRSAKLLDTPVEDDGAEEIARRARGTPRIVNRLLRRVRDYAQVRAHGHITMKVAMTALDLLEVDRFGLDEIDQKIMRTVLEKFGGGPVGINTIAASIGEEPETIEEVYEPYLIQLGFLHRSPRGRIATERAYDYFNVSRRFGGRSGGTADQPELF